MAVSFVEKGISKGAEAVAGKRGGMGIGGEAEEGAGKGVRRRKGKGARKGKGTGKGARKGRKRSARTLAGKDSEADEEGGNEDSCECSDREGSNSDDNKDDLPSSRLPGMLDYNNKAKDPVMKSPFQVEHEFGVGPWDLVFTEITQQLPTK
jgi:hypothetical protein